MLKADFLFNFVYLSVYLSPHFVDFLSRKLLPAVLFVALVDHLVHLLPKCIGDLVGFELVVVDLLVNLLLQTVSFVESALRNVGVLQKSEVVGPICDGLLLGQLIHKDLIVLLNSVIARRPLRSLIYIVYQVVELFLYDIALGV